MEGIDVTILPAFIKMIFGNRPFRRFPQKRYSVTKLLKICVSYCKKSFPAEGYALKHFKF